MMFKKCAKCKRVRLISEFGIDKRSPDGRAPRCKDCRAEYERRQKVKNPEAARERNQRYEESHQEEKRERNRIYRETNREEIKKRGKKWRKENPDKMREHRRKWKEANPEKVVEANHNWHAANKERNSIRSRIWKALNPFKVLQYKHTRRAKVKGNGGKFTAAEWKALCEKFGNKCLVPGCRQTDLTPDHVIPIDKGGSNSIDNIQPLCAHHNFVKHTKETDYR